jgi:hypothetical protein
MRLRFQRIIYDALNGRQQEAFNFQKVSAVLAAYGFTTVRLTADWRGADFIAQHFDGITFLRVQLKGRCTFDKKYIGRDLHMCFPSGDHWFLYPHDEVLDKALAETSIGGTDSWKTDGGYSFPAVTKKLKALLELYRLNAEEDRGERSPE